MQASAIAEQDASSATAYSRFRAAVAQAQFTQWLAQVTSLGRVIDVSGPRAGTRGADSAAKAGHSVLRVAFPGATAGHPGEAAAGPRHPRLRVATADDGGLGFLASHCADAVIAEDRTLSRNLAAEALVGEIARVLKPGGRVLASVDSLTLGMSILAQQHHWPHLVDLPHADVVLVPWPDGSITRCYGAEHLRELFVNGGFEVNWIRPRTVLAPTTVSYLLDRDPGSFEQLLSAELRAHGDESVGDQLIISAALSPATGAGDPVSTGRARSAR